MGGVHTKLLVGQSVALDEQATGVHITVLAADQPGQKIVQVGDDYVIFDNESAGIATRVPTHLIRSVTMPAPVEQPQAA